MADTVSDGPTPQGSSSDKAPGALTERRGNILVITINRPDARNAVNAAVSIGVGDALLQAQDDLETARVTELAARVTLNTSVSELHRLEGSSISLYRIDLPGN